MILLDQPASLTCDEEGCIATVPVKLCLNILGGFQFKGEAKLIDGWQLLASRDAPQQPIAAKCPVHAQKLQTLKQGLVIPNAH